MQDCEDGCAVLITTPERPAATGYAHGEAAAGAGGGGAGSASTAVADAGASKAGTAAGGVAAAARDDSSKPLGVWGPHPTSLPKGIGTLPPPPPAAIAACPSSSCSALFCPVARLFSCLLYYALLSEQCSQHIASPLHVAILQDGGGAIQ